MKKGYSVELTTLAEDQILQIAQYIIEEFQAPETAKRVVDKIESELSKLSEMPERIEDALRHTVLNRPYLGSAMEVILAMADEL